MCRWIGYFGDPLRPEQLLYDTPHSLIEQSRRAIEGLMTQDGTVPEPVLDDDTPF